MLTHRTTLLVVSLACSAAHCGGDEDRSTDDGTSSTTFDEPAANEEDVYPRNTPAMGCKSRMFVKRITALSTCGIDGGWNGTVVGEGPLAEFCEYTWLGVEPPTPGELAAMGNPIPSCPRVTPQGGPHSVHSIPRQGVYDAFMASVGRVSLQPLVSQPAIRPRMYLIDTIPESLIDQDKAPNEPHGLKLRELAQGILCDAPFNLCPVDFINVLGLPRVAPDKVDLQAGGSFGSLMDLARGINEATEDQKQSKGGPWVLALAVGWEPLGAYGKAASGTAISTLLSSEDTPADVQAVLAVLTRAWCEGAVIVAAAGNITGEACEQGPAIGPAFFHDLEPLDGAQCESMGFGAGVAETAPLLLSATGVGFDGLPLANSRGDVPGALAAQGATFSAVSGASAMMIGSSVATIAMASAVAALWTVRPAMSRQDMFASLRDFDASSKTGVDICRVIRAVCPKNGSSGCMELVCSESAEAIDVAKEQVDALLTNPAKFTLGPDYASPAQSTSACGQTSVFPFVKLPDVSSGPVLPWVKPQPTRPYCPTCFAKLHADALNKVTVDLSLASLPPSPYPPMIETQTEAGTERYVIGPVPPVNVYTVISVNRPSAGQAVQQVRLVYYVNDSNSNTSYHLQSEPLFIVR